MQTLTETRAQIRAIDGFLADQLCAACAEVQHRRLRQAADDLVRARDHEVGAEREGVCRQLLVEGHMCAPCLVDDQRHAVCVCNLGERAHVGDSAEVRR